MSGPALSRRERLILREIERDLLDDEDFVLSVSDLLLTRPPAERPGADAPPPAGTTPPDRLAPDAPPAGHARERPPRRARSRRLRPPGASPHAGEPRLRSRCAGFRAAVRQHGLFLLIPLCAVLAGITFAGAPVYVAVVFAVVLAATVVLGIARYRKRRRGPR